jgi:hypothetical protein
MTLSISPSRSELQQPVLFVVTMSLLVFGMLGMQSNKLKSLRAVDRSLDPVVLQRETLLRGNKLSTINKFPKFGFNNLVANTTFIDFLSYYGTPDARSIDGYSLGFDYFDVILKQDPKFFLAYYYLSATGSTYMANPARSVSIMNEGFKSIGPRSPEYSYYLWRLKAIDELLFVGDIKAAQNSMQTAADWANQIGDEEGRRVANISQKTAQHLAKKPDSLQARYSAWTNILGTAVDDNARKLAVAKIRELGGKVEIDAQGKLKLTPPSKD